MRSSIRNASLVPALWQSVSQSVSQATISHPHSQGQLVDLMRNERLQVRQELYHYERIPGKRGVGNAHLHGEGVVVGVVRYDLRPWLLLNPRSKEVPELDRKLRAVDRAHRINPLHSRPLCHDAVAMVRVSE